MIRINLLPGPKGEIPYARSRGQADRQQPFGAQPPPLLAGGIGLNSRNGVAHAGGHPAGPEIGDFSDMGIHINDRILLHSLSSRMWSGVVTQLDDKRSGPLAKRADWPLAVELLPS